MTTMNPCATCRAADFQPNCSTTSQPGSIDCFGHVAAKQLASTGSEQQRWPFPGRGAAGCGCSESGTSVSHELSIAGPAECSVAEGRHSHARTLSEKADLMLV